MSLLQQADPTCRLVFLPLDTFIHASHAWDSSLRNSCLMLGRLLTSRLLLPARKGCREHRCRASAFPAMGGKTRFIFCYFSPLVLFSSTLAAWRSVSTLREIVKDNLATDESLQQQLTLCVLMDCYPPASSVLGILQARILEWVTMPSSRGSSWPGNLSRVSYISCIAGKFFITEKPGKPTKECTAVLIIWITLCISSLILIYLITGRYKLWHT